MMNDVWIAIGFHPKDAFWQKYILPSLQYGQWKDIQDSNTLFWRDIRNFGRGLLIVFTGVLFTSASIFIKEYFIALVLTTIGIVLFAGGLYMTLTAMDRQIRELKPPAGESDRKL